MEYLNPNEKYGVRLPCYNKRCSSYGTLVNIKITPKGKHLRADCSVCGRYIKFISHREAGGNSTPLSAANKEKRKDRYRRSYYEDLILKIPALDQKWPYGKTHNGRTLREIIRDFPDYVEWVGEEMDGLSESWKCLLQDAIEDYQREKNGE